MTGTLIGGYANVLNAFRHHRGRHVLREAGGEWSRQVLNAFRHHRGRHLRFLVGIRPSL